MNNFQKTLVIVLLAGGLVMLGFSVMNTIAEVKVEQAIQDMHLIRQIQ